VKLKLLARRTIHSGSASRSKENTDPRPSGLVKKNVTRSILMKIVTTVLLGLIYPLAMSAVSQTLFGDKANGQLIVREGQVVGSRIIGQPFTGAGYFHSRPSAAGSGYDGANSGGTNLGPRNQKLIERVKQDTASLHRENRTHQCRLTWLRPPLQASTRISHPLLPTFRCPESRVNATSMKISSRC
jgi:K+-transporting ATPase, c chain